jgi:ADP-ribosylglycohydrolase
MPSANTLPTTNSSIPHTERFNGVLLGTALGDALGLPAEGMRAHQIARRWGKVDRFRLLGQIGFVSDDTEQSALLAECLLQSPDDPERCPQHFRRALLAWFTRLPFGAGLATLRACGRIAVGRRPSGVLSAGNGAAMRAGVLGVFFSRDLEARHRFGIAIAETTHRDQRAVDGALLVAELAAQCAGATASSDRLSLVRRAIDQTPDGPLRKAAEHAVDLAEPGLSVGDAATALGTSGYVLHTVPFALYCFLQGPTDPLQSLTTAISAGGDTDSYGAILGAWLGALEGEVGLPSALLAQIHDGPFGPTHLRSLGSALAATQQGERVALPRYSRVGALGRNLALYPVVIGHGLRRLFPF